MDVWQRALICPGALRQQTSLVTTSLVTGETVIRIPAPSSHHNCWQMSEVNKFSVEKVFDLFEQLHSNSIVLKIFLVLSHPILSHPRNGAIDVQHLMAIPSDHRAPGDLWARGRGVAKHDKVCPGCGHSVPDQRILPLQAWGSWLVLSTIQELGICDQVNELLFLHFSYVFYTSAILINSFAFATFSSVYKIGLIVEHDLSIERFKSSLRVLPWPHSIQSCQHEQYTFILIGSYK